jgi:hypothetical protein
MEKLKEKHVRAVFDENEGFVVDDTGYNSAIVTREVAIDFLKKYAEDYINHMPTEQAFDEYLNSL